MESVHRQTGRMPERLAVAPVPMPFQRAMRLWQDLHSGRSVGGLGITPLSWVDLHAYMSVTGERLSAGDLEAVRIIDAAFMESRAAAEERRGKVKG